MLAVVQMRIVGTDEQTFLPRNGVGFISAQAIGAGGTPGSGDPNQGDFAYAHSTLATTCALVGWLASGSVWVVQPLQ
jgi:hypothetical protein